MTELFPEGFEEVAVEEGVELAAYTSAGGEERLWQVFGPGSVQPVEAGWAEAWKRFHRPVHVGPLWVGPPWEAPGAAAIPVVVDPGGAFGTGAHATTRLCLELLLAVSPAPDVAMQDLTPAPAVLDVGCGSGILAIAAAKLGFAPVVALDLDDAAIQATRANAAANGVDLEVRRADVLTDPLPPAELALANVSLDVVERVASRLKTPSLITSGYLVSERPAPRGWEHRERREAEGWAADLFGLAPGAEGVDRV